MLSPFQNFCFMDLSEMIANHASKLLWGNGHLLESQLTRNQIIIQRWKRDIDFDDFFYKSEKVCSKYGWVGVQIDRLNGGKMCLSILQPFYQKQILRWFDSEEMAITYARVTNSESFKILRTVYTKNTIERSGGVLEGGEFQLSGKQENIPQELKLPLKERHNLGVVPVRFIQNLPHKNFYGGEFDEFYPDTKPVANLQKFLDHTYSKMWEEIENNITHVFGDFSPVEMQNISKSPEQYNRHWRGHSQVEQYIKGGLLVQTKMGMIGQSSSQPVSILMGDPKIQSYAEGIKFIKSQCYEGSGYSAPDENSTQKTEAEVTLLSAKDAETTRIKRTIRTRKYSEMFEAMFLMEGCNKYESQQFIFQIKENIGVDRLKAIEIATSMVAAGFSTRQEEIAKLKGITEIEAEELMAKIDTQRASEIVLDFDVEEKDNGN